MKFIWLYCPITFVYIHVHVYVQTVHCTCTNVHVYTTADPSKSDMTKKVLQNVSRNVHHMYKNVHVY